MEVVLIKPRSIPKTTSGKIQRSKCRAFYEGTGEGEGGLKRMATLHDDAGEVRQQSTHGTRSVSTSSTSSTVVEQGASRSSADVEDWLHTRLTAHVASLAEAGAGAGAHTGGQGATPAVSVDMGASWAETGLDSVAAVNISAELSEFIGQHVPPSAFFMFASPRALACAPGLLTGGLSMDEGAASGDGSSLLQDAEDIPEAWHTIGAFDEYTGIRAQIEAMQGQGEHSPPVYGGTPRWFCCPVLRGGGCGC